MGVSQLDLPLIQLNPELRLQGLVLCSRWMQAFIAVPGSNVPALPTTTPAHIFRSAGSVTAGKYIACKSYITGPHCPLCYFLLSEYDRTRNNEVIPKPQLLVSLENAAAREPARADKARQRAAAPSVDRIANSFRQTGPLTTLGRPF